MRVRGWGSAQVAGVLVRGGEGEEGGCVTTTHSMASTPSAIISPALAATMWMPGEIQGRWSGDVGEIWARCGRDMGEI